MFSSWQRTWSIQAVLLSCSVLMIARFIFFFPSRLLLFEITHNCVFLYIIINTILCLSILFCVIRINIFLCYMHIMKGNKKQNCDCALLPWQKRIAICLSTCPSICLSTCLSICPSADPPAAGTRGDMSFLVSRTPYPSHPAQHKKDQHKKVLTRTKKCVIVLTETKEAQRHDSEGHYPKDHE